MSQKLVQLFWIFAISSLASAKNLNTNINVTPFNTGLEIFGKRLFSELERTHSEKNIIFSPLSVETCIGMIRAALEGNTAAEIDQAFATPNQNKNTLAYNFRNVLAQYQNSSILQIANKVYVNTGYRVQKMFKRTLEKDFFSSIARVKFQNSERASRTINLWVESKTNNLIKDLIDPSLIDDSTKLVLVNAIHFKGQWVSPFLISDTFEDAFYIDHETNVDVDMMYVKDDFLYGKLPDLKAAAVELPYKNSDLSMLIILPDETNDLANVEQKLKSLTLADLASKMSNKTTEVFLPKFKAEMNVDLKDPLQNLGIRRMFTPNAEFANILEPSQDLEVSFVVHKAVIEVTEEGTEAAAATGFGINNRFGEDSLENFYANRPFIYFIKNSQNVILFSGNVKNFNK